jgi:NAD(P)H-dependent FMN reductase
MMNSKNGNKPGEDRPKLEIIIASTRPGRVGLPVGQWFADWAREHSRFEVEVVDLAKLNLPFMDEPKHPRLRQYVHQHTKDWSATVESADAFVFVTPEYNHSMNAPLKNALDYLNQEWQNKPVGFVSYGGVSGGTRAVQVIKPVVAALKMMAIPEAVNIPFVNQFLNEEKQFEPNEITEKAATMMLDELYRWAMALRPLREPVAQPSA